MRFTAYSTKDKQLYTADYTAFECTPEEMKAELEKQQECIIVDYTTDVKQVKTEIDIIDYISHCTFIN